MNWLIFTPELFILATAMTFLGLSLASADGRRDYLTAISLSAAAVGVCIAAVPFSGDLFRDTYRVDLFSQVFKALLSMGFFLTVFLCSDLDGVAEKRHSEFYCLLSVCTLAMMMLTSSVHLLTVWVALELSSYSLYILVFLRRDDRLGVSAGLKYFFIGASASAVMLLGLALLYGATRTGHLMRLIEALPGSMDQPTVMIGLFMTLSGFLFKLAVFPFHFWAPDVYEGAAHQVTAYIATVSKVAAIAILLRVVALAGGGSGYLAHVLAAMAIVTMTVGNLSAIVQKDFKKLMAYSSIAQAGYILIGILSMNASGYTAAAFYAPALLVMKFTCFMVLVMVAGGGNMEVNRLAGLHRRSPLMALALMMALFGLAGIPPTVGFTGKLLIFKAAMERGYLVLVLIAMANVVVSLFYYLLVIKAAYLDEPKESQPPLVLAPATRILAFALLAVIVVAGIFPTHLIEIARDAVQALL